MLHIPILNEYQFSGWMIWFKYCIKVWYFVRILMSSMVGLQSLRLDRHLKGEFMFFLIHELDVPQLGESKLMGPKKSLYVKFFTTAFFGRT